MSVCVPADYVFARHMQWHGDAAPPRCHSEMMEMNEGIDLRSG